MKAMLRGPAEFLLTLGASYLPQYYRERWIGPVAPDLARGALLTGIAQAVVCLGLYIFGYLRWFAYVGALLARAAASSTVAISERDFAAGMGMTVMISYLLRPTTMLVTYFALEGTVRMAAALVTGETVPTLPLVLAALVQRKIEHRRREKRWGVRVPDLVEQGTGSDLRILSCRPKDWGSLVTLQYRGELYVVTGEESAAAPRRFVYLLNRLPAGTVARGLRDYDPQEPVAEDVPGSAAP